jgi:hypothetical protein
MYIEIKDDSAFKKLLSDDIARIEKKIKESNPSIYNTS